MAELDLKPYREQAAREAAAYQRGAEAMAKYATLYLDAAYGGPHAKDIDSILAGVTHA